MSYSPLRAIQYVKDVDRDKSDDNKNLLDYAADSASNDPTYSSLVYIIDAYRKKKSSDVQAQSLMTRVMLYFSRKDDEEEENELAKGLFHLAKKALIQIGKRIVVSFLRPLISMAFNIVRTIVSFAVRGIIRFVLAPIITGVVGIIMANPLTALAGLAVGGAVWWAWNRFFRKDNQPSPDGVAIPETTYVPSTTTSTLGNPTPTGITTVPQVYSPVQTATAGLTGSPVPKGKFAGFGDDVDAYIKETAQLYNLPEDVLRGFVKMEGGWTGAMSPTGAIGTGQFILSTWNSLAATPAGKAIGMVAITTGKNGTFRTQNDPRFNKRVNTLATGLLARQNADILIKNKLPVTGENLYMMHNIGPGIINVMLGRPVSEATMTAMEQNGMKAGWTPAQFLAWQKGRFNQQYAIANQKPTTTTAANTDAPKKPVVMDKPPAKVASSAQAANDSKKTSVADTAPAKSDKTLVTKGKAIIALNN